MDDPLLMAMEHCLTDLLEHAEDNGLIQSLVTSVPLNPLQEVASLTILHHYDDPINGGNVDSIKDLDHMDVVEFCLDADLLVIYAN